MKPLCKKERQKNRNTPLCSAIKKEINELCSFVVLVIWLKIVVLKYYNLSVGQHANELTSTYQLFFCL